MGPESPLSLVTLAASLLAALTAAPLLASAQTTAIPPSSKRGLVFTPNPQWPQDNYIWAAPPSDLTWYYNYGVTPSTSYGNTTQESFEFIPMLWGAPSDASSTTFLEQVQSLVSGGRNVSHVMTFNEPDGTTETGGSQVDPSFGAQVWINNIIPLQEMGIRVGLPACTGGTGGISWLEQFLGNCSTLISTGGTVKNCTYDFVPLHWYGNFQGLASHIGSYVAQFPNTSIWVTEYSYNNQSLSDTQAFMTTSLEYMDRLDYLERYSYFGAFRSEVSNVGPNAAMLSDGGQLTQLGVWYLGENGTGVSPTESPGARVKLEPVRVAIWAAVVVIAAFFL